MTCTTPINPMSELISDAYILAGSPQNGPITGPLSIRAIRALNAILDSWNGKPLYIPYQASIDIVSDGSLAYIIGLEGDDHNDVNVPANPFEQIKSLTYNVGSASYRCTFMAPPAFNQILIKGTAGLPQFWTYEIRDKYTILRLYPEAQNGIIIKPVGKQRLSNVEFFSSSSQIPAKYRRFLTYALAAELSAYGSGRPNDQFQKNWPDVKRIPLSSNNDDLTMDNAGTKPSSGRRWGMNGR